jgi:general secretion pathway protein B
MSFILDALKKSEAERNRQTGPVLMDVRIAAPRRRLPTWAWALGIVLAANLVVLAYLLLRTPNDAREAVTPVVAAPVAATPAPPAATAINPAPAPANIAPATVAAAVAAPSDIPAATSTATSTLQDDASLPSMQDLIAMGMTLPPLQLNLHAYDPNPASRYVLLNSTRLREGEYSPEGIKVERITTSGVILELRGRRFALRAGG